METEGLKQFLSFKISYLEEQRKQLHNVVDIQVDKALQAGTTWLKETEIQDQEETITFDDVNQMIEKTAVFMARKCSEISGMNQTSSVTAAGIKTSEDSSHSSSVKNFMKRMEDRVASMASTMERVLEKQSELEKAVEEKAELDSCREKTYQEVQTNVSLLTEKQSTVELEQNRKLENLACQLQALQEVQLEMENRHDNLIEKQEDDKEKTQTCLQKLTKNVEALELNGKNIQSHMDYLETCFDYDKQLDQLLERTAKLETVAQKVEKLEAVEKKTEAVGVLEKRLDKLEAISLKPLYSEVEEQRREEFTGMHKNLKTLEQKFEELSAKTSCVSKKVDDHDSVLQELNQSREEAKSALKDHAACRENDCQKLTELQDRLTRLKWNNKEALKSLGKKYDSVELQYKMVCQIVADRLAPLEKLRGIFNKNLKYRDENIKKLNDVVHQVAALMPKVSQLESSSFRTTPVAFSAAFNSAQKVFKGNIVNHFKDIICNMGNHFDPDTGNFTAPVDGVYGVSLNMYQWHDGGISLHVSKAYGSSEAPTTDMILNGDTAAASSGDCVFGVTEMNAGDRLHVFVNDVEKRPRLSNGTVFSCFLIK